MANGRKESGSEKEKFETCQMVLEGQWRPRSSLRSIFLQHAISLCAASTQQKAFVALYSAMHAHS